MIIHRTLVILLPIFIIGLCSFGFAQKSEWERQSDSLVNKYRLEQSQIDGQTPDSLLSDLVYPVKLDSISVLDSRRDDVTRIYGNGYFRENEGFDAGVTFFTDPKREIVLRIEYGTDWGLWQFSFSRGEKEDMPDSIRSIKQLPRSAISTRLNPKLTLEGGIGLGTTPRDLLRKYGKPTIDTVQQDCRLISYKADYRMTKKVLFYEAWFRFRDNKLIRFKIYNGD
jgi:hypothetical protein